MTPHHAKVAVVVIGYDDAAHVTDAVRSALAQGDAVREVVAVDDCSADGSADLLDALAAGEPRLRVIRRTVNSGGCGTPRNDGIDAATAPYVMFLDSDDVLPPGAVDALLGAAEAHGVEVAAGLCVRRELPSGREVAWEKALYAGPAVLPNPSRRPRLAHDTLCVNKLYRTDFLRAHGIRFPEGRHLYEDHVFTARVLAAAPRIALIPDTVYVWHVRRDAERLSISLDRADVSNWRARTEANRAAYEILLGAGEKRLARAVRAKFLDHDLRMYARELELRSAAYRRAWWEHTRGYLETFDAADLTLNPGSPGRILARVLLASPAPRDLPRLRDLAARPARLLPPYARARDGTPVWSSELPQVTLEPLLDRPVPLLPIAVDAELRTGVRGTRLLLRLHELYGRMARSGPVAADVVLVRREDGLEGLRREVRLLADRYGDLWTAETAVEPAALPPGTWDLRLTLRFRDGASREVSAHATAGGGRLRRRAVADGRHGVRRVVLLQPYRTHAGAFALRTASGWRGVAGVVRRRVGRLLH
ncbi:glycosyltransferase family 2 protein [Streptomyces sp. NPDC048566]|uniref:glycosyltransferase family 2 protein n=1 Tax=Streptomyces sp. NPDC048566 TaxID=3365569 RepID=UPI00371B65DC